MKTIIENPIHLIADEGMILTDGEVYSSEVWLGKLDSPDNWSEIPDENVTAEHEVIEQ